MNTRDMRKYGIAALLLFIGACKSSEGPQQLVTTSVQVSSTPTQISINETAQASAIVKDQNGNTLTGKTISWVSLNPSVATVSSTGVIKGVAVGNATIQGTVDGVTGSATISVIGLQTSCASGLTTLDIATGDVRTVNVRATGGCIKVASTAAASSYVLIGANTNALPDVLSTYALKSDEGENIPAGSLLTTPYHVSSQVSVPDESSVPGFLQSQFETKLRLQERRELDFDAGRRSYQSRVAKSDVRYSQSVAVPAVGDKGTFKVPTTCSKFATVTATVKEVSTRAIIYLDDAAPAGGFTDSDYQGIAAEFDNLIYPTDTDYFGTPLDQDNNSRIIILYTPEVNKLTPAGSSGFVGGFFFVGDFFPPTGSNACAQSNQAEIFYVLAPDPSGTINNNVRTTSSVRQGTRGTIAHEFQHMINASERFRSPVTTDFEATWLDEALAHTAEDLNGRALKALPDGGNYPFSALISNLNDYNAFFFQNFARLRFYLQNPGPNSPTSSMADTSLAVRGAAWSLVRYTADQYSPNGDIKGFIRSLIPGPDTGVVNLTNHAGGVPFDTLIAGWMVANYADDAGIPNLNPKYTYKMYNMRDNVANATNSTNKTYPLQVTAISGSGVVIANLQALSGSGNYFSFSRAGGALARTFRMLNNDLSTAASFTGATLILLRTQ